MSTSAPLQPQTALIAPFGAGISSRACSAAIFCGLYLFAPEINHILYHSLEDVPARADLPLPASLLVQKAAEAAQGEVWA
jgi:hypothetical protein